MDPTTPNPEPIPQTAPAESLPKQITFDEFQAVEMLVGAVVSAERVPNADKLLKLIVDFGPRGAKTVVAGIAKSYPDPSPLVGGRFAFVVNLAPRKMKGLTSEAMLLAAPVAGNPEYVVPVQVSGGEPGARVG